MKAKGVVTGGLLALVFAPFGLILIGLFGLLLLAVLLAGGGSNIASSLSMSLTGNDTQASGKGTVSLAQLVQLAHQAGIPDDELAIAVAIAEAESGGNPDAVDDDSDGSVDRGLWQINTSWNSVLPGNEFNEAYNAKSMAFISQGGTYWSPWTTYRTGAYLTYLPQAQQAVAAAGY
jgi:Lysozyme like domain